MSPVLKTTWDELRDAGHSSVTDFCRDLVRQEEEYHMGGGPGALKKITLPEKIEVYRGDMLCMTVHDIYKAAEIEPYEDKRQGIHFRKFKPDPKMSEETKQALKLKRVQKLERASLGDV